MPATGAASPDRRERVTARVVDRIRSAILREAYPGGRVLHEEPLARRYRVSRPVLREALRQLAAEGFVELRGRGEAAVTELTPAGLIELTDMLVLLEPLALRLAIPRLGSEDLARAEAALDALERQENAGRVAAIAWRFHSALYAPCGRPVLVEQIRRLRAQATRYDFARGRPGRAAHEPVVRAHRLLVALLRDGHAEEAVERLRRHVGARASDLANVFTRVEPPPGSRPPRGPRRRA